MGLPTAGRVAIVASLSALIVSAVTALVATPGAHADTGCQFARFTGQVNGIVRVCVIAPQGAQIDAKINSPISGLLGLSFANNTGGFRNPEVSSFGPGHQCLSFQQGWLEPEPPIAAVLVNLNFNTIDFAPLADSPPVAAQELNGCLLR